MNSPIEHVRQTLHRLFQKPPMVLMPKKRVALPDLTLELWVSQRKLPLLLRAQAIIVPTAPDLKMVFGIAKMVRDMGADAVQYEANKVAPLAPGQAFVGTGARFRYKFTALAVIFDQVKRTNQQLITSAIGNAIRQLRDRGATSVVIPDMTENLLAQPNWITAEQRRQTAAITARLMIEAILASGSNIKNVKIWVWDTANTEFFLHELEQLKQRRRALAA